jgi:hypothetical protein
MLKRHFVAFFTGAVVLVAAGAVTAAVAPDAVAPVVKKVQVWAKGAPTKATLQGQLRLEGEPMAYTRIELHTSNGLFVANTDANGLFELRGLPAGEAQISVHAYEWSLAPREPRPVEEGDYPEPPPLTLPSHYRNRETSGLTANLHVGEQWQNLYLTAE